ncbi:restriction endonuclease [Embleya sp. NPDC050493]|uniref:restriction endonuclease n=1 Tax=Embleya sp. NPDC050493 TaxID=3363989 RepID=UPI0037BCE9BC
MCRFPDCRTAVIQCKRYTTKSRIPPREMRDLLGAKAHFGADVAVFVTTTGFTKQSTEFAVANGILAIHRDFFGLGNKGTPHESIAGLNGFGQGPTRLPGALGLRTRSGSATAAVTASPARRDRRASPG